MPAAASDAAARELARSWARAWGGVGAGDGGEVVYRRLLAAYGEPQRKYHTLQHLRECFDLVALDLVFNVCGLAGQYDLFEVSKRL